MKLRTAHKRRRRVAARRRGYVHFKSNQGGYVRYETEYGFIWMPLNGLEQPRFYRTYR